MKIEDHINWAQVVASKFRKEKNIPIEHEEAVSLSMMALVKAAKNYNGKVEFRSYAWLCITSLLKDYIARNTSPKRHAVVLSLEDVSIERLPSINEIEKGIINTELVDKLFKCLNTNQARTIRLHYLDGYSIKEIAKDRNVTPASIWLLMSRAIKKMKETRI